MIEKLNQKERKSEFENDLSNLQREIIQPEIESFVENAINRNQLQLRWLNSAVEKNDIVNYIVSWNLNSGKEQKIESAIKELCSSPFARKLKYLLDNPDKSLQENIQTIKDKEKTQQDKITTAITKLQTENIQKKEEKSFIEKWLERWINRLKWLVSKIIDFKDIPNNIWKKISEMLTTWEQYIWRPYKYWWLDCSAFLSKLLSKFLWKNQKWTSKSFYNTFKWSKVKSRSDIRCWDVLYQPWHVEMIVGKPFIENWKTYVMTLWSSSDTSKVDPMYDWNHKPINWKNWVGYRKRKIYPNPRHSYEFIRPPYENWSKTIE